MTRDAGVYLVKSSSPRMLEKDVPIGSSIDLHLERDIDTTQDFYPKIFLQSMADESIHPVEIKVGYRSIKIIPSFDLLPHTPYRLTLKGGENGIHDIRNIPIEVSWSLEFETGKSKRLDPPSILKPMHQGIVMRSFEAEWTANSGAAYYEVEIARTSQFDPVIWPSFGTKAYETKVKPNIMAPGRYYMRVRAVDAEGIQGAYSEVVQFLFETPNNSVAKTSEVSEATTEAEVFEQMIEGLATEATEKQITGVLQMTPKPGSLHVPLNQKEIRIKVKGPIDPSVLAQIIITKERMG